VSSDLVLVVGRHERYTEAFRPGAVRTAVDRLVVHGLADVARPPSLHGRVDDARGGGEVVADGTHNLDLIGVHDA